MDYAINAGRYVKEHLQSAGVDWDNKELSSLLDMAGGGLSVRWLKRLSTGLVGKITIRQLIGLRRLLGVPVDTIIGLEYTHPAKRDRMAGLKRIRHELGGSKPRTHKELLHHIGCSAPITRRIESFSTWAVLNKAADINTPAADIKEVLKETFSIPVLVSLKWMLHNNIDDILGLGEYDPAIFANNTPEAEEIDEEAEKARERARAADLLAQFERNRSRVKTPVNETLEEEKARITREMQEEAAMLERDIVAGNTITTFRPAGA